MKRYEFIDEHRHEFLVQRMCNVLGVSASGYYAWRSRPLSQRAQENHKLTTEIVEVHEESRKTYGSPRIYKELVARGRSVSENRVAKLMQAGNIAVKRKKKRKITTDSRHDYPVAPNLLNRNFKADRPDQKWVGDITYIPTAEGWLYLATVMDLFSRKIVGWAMEATLESSLVEQAFLMAVQNRKPPKNLLHHSDRGSQYAGDLYRKLLADYNIIVSMSRTGNCYDNAVMESFFSTLKCDQVFAQNYQSRQEAKTDIFGYIEGFYNPVRRHSTLDYQSPVEFERRYYNNFS